MNALVLRNPGELVSRREVVLGTVANLKMVEADFEIVDEAHLVKARVRHALAQYEKMANFQVPGKVLAIL